MKKIAFLAVLAILLFALITTVLAASWTYHYFALDISGTSDGISGKMVNNLGDGKTWGANILTYVDNPAIQLNLGWDWFSGTEKCGSYATQNQQGGAYYGYTQQRASTIFLTKQPCGGTRYGLSSGKHIVTAGITNYYDTWTKTEQIP